MTEIKSPAASGNRVIHLLFVALSVLSIASRAYSAVTVSAVSRASVVEGAGTSSVTVYGGVAGDLATCAYPSGGSALDSTCSSCIAPDSASGDAGLLACNEQRINGELQLVISVSSDAIDGRVAITDSEGSTPLTNISASTGLTKGSTGTVTIAWKTICAHLFTKAGDTTGLPDRCEPSDGFDQISGSLRIGISAAEDGADTNLSGAKDEYRSVTFVIRRGAGQATGVSGQSLALNCDDDNAIGICQFEMGAGDEKAVVKTLQFLNGFPLAGNTQFKYVRFLYSTTGFSEINAGSPHHDLPVSGTDVATASVSPKRIEGLTNDATHYFKAAVVDSAGNVGYYSAAADDARCASGATCHIVTPSEVVGVLSNTDCFIATAAYGGRDPDGTFAPEVGILRDFRDRFLMHSGLGRAFVRTYYAVSPPLAMAIVDKPATRALIRAMLTPVVALAAIAMDRGLWLAAVAALSVLGIAVLLATAILRTSKSRRFWVLVLFSFFMSSAMSTLQSSFAYGAEPQEELDKAIEQEEAPEPEYPYPGAQDVEFKKPVAKQKSRRRTTNSPKPIAVTEDGDYLYPTSESTDEVHHGRPAKVKFSGLPGRTPPETITAEGDYLYPVEHSDFSGAAGIRFGIMAPPNLKNPNNNLTFSQIYGSEPLPALIFEYEYPLTRAIGRMGIKVETGFFVKQAQGRFKNPAVSTDPADERFTFVLVPLQAAVIYRFQFADAQWVVPFVEGGANYSGIAELRDDNRPPRIGGSPALVASAGASFILDWLDRRALNQLESDYGINHVYFTAQYRYIKGLKSQLDVSSNMISAGITFDY